MSHLVPAVPPENTHLHNTALKHADRPASLEESMGRVHAPLAEHTALLEEHSADLSIIMGILAEHTIRFDVLEDRFDKLEITMNTGFAKVFQLLGA